MRKILYWIAIVSIFIIPVLALSGGCTGGTTSLPATVPATQSQPNTDIQAIMVYSGAGLAKPMDGIGKLFKQKYNIDAQYNYGGCNTLLSQIELTKQGDVFAPGEMYYFDMAVKSGFMDTSEIVAYHIPAITVPKGNPAKITKLADLAKPGLKLVWGDPKAAAIGRLGNEILEKNGIKDAVWKNVIATAPTMKELITYISMNQADAALNWSDAGLSQGVEVIEIPMEQNIIEKIPVGILAFSNQKDLARKFVEFCASYESKSIFEKYGMPGYPNAKYEQ